MPEAGSQDRPRIVRERVGQAETRREVALKRVFLFALRLAPFSPAYTSRNSWKSKFPSRLFSSVGAWKISYAQSRVDREPAAHQKSSCTNAACLITLNVGFSSRNPRDALLK